MTGLLLFVWECVCPSPSPLQQEMACSWSFHQVTAVSSFSLSISLSFFLALTHTFSLLFMPKSKSLCFQRWFTEIRFKWLLFLANIYYHMDFWHLRSYKWAIHVHKSVSIIDSGHLLVFAAYLWMFRVTKRHSILFVLLRIWARMPGKDQVKNTSTCSTPLTQPVKLSFVQTHQTLL